MNFNSYCILTTTKIAYYASELATRDESDDSFAVDLMLVLGELTIQSCNNSYLATC